MKLRHMNRTLKFFELNYLSRLAFKGTTVNRFVFAR